MPVPTHLLERAHQLINANQIQNAELVLDAVVRVDPQNVEAWMTYMRIHQNQNDLDWLKERLLKTKELSETDKAELINYHHHLTQKINGTKDATFWVGPLNYLPEKDNEEITPPEEAVIRFELIDVFDYPTKIAKIEGRALPRRRAIYNPFSIEFTNEIAKVVLAAISRDPLWKQIEAYIQKAISLVKDVRKNPREVYVKLSKLPHFEKYAGIALLTLFVLGIRLAISSYLFGYAFLVMFIVGGGWWLLNFGNRNTTSIGGQSRVYLHEYKINLPEIKEIQNVSEKESGEANSKKNVE